MAEVAVKTHPWHLVDPSPWPILGALAALVTAIGAVIFFHSQNFIVLVAGGVLMMITLMAWWRDVIREGEYKNDHSIPVRKGLRIGMVMFIASEVMFFFAFFWAQYHSSLPILNLVAGPWPPEGIETLNTFGIPLLNTVILLTSGATITWAHHGLIHGNRNTLLIGTGLSVVLGVIFLGFQAFEYIEATFTLDGGIYPSTFYLATGFHGFHVFVGVVFLTVCFFRAKKGHFTPDHHVGFEAAAWYWHFVDVVWLFLYVSIYFWGSSSFGHITAG